MLVKAGLLTRGGGGSSRVVKGAAVEKENKPKPKDPRVTLMTSLVKKLAGSLKAIEKSNLRRNRKTETFIYYRRF